MASSLGTKIVAFVGRTSLAFEISNNLAQIVKLPSLRRASITASISWFEESIAEMEERLRIVSAMKRKGRRLRA